MQDLIDALKVFDSDHDGKISVKDFKNAMSNMGEKMSDEEIGEIVDDSDLVNNEYILIDDFARMIMNRIWGNNLHLLTSLHIPSQSIWYWLDPNSKINYFIHNIAYYINCGEIISTLSHFYCFKLPI